VKADARPLDNGYWVLPGRWFAGEYPGGRTAAETRQRLTRLIAAGLDYFVDLTAAGELPEYATLLPAAVAYVRKPLPDHGVPASAEDMAAILGTIDAALSAGRKLYLHCRAGIGRTGMTVGCYLATQNRDADAALDALDVLWRQSARSLEWPSIPETDEQVAYVAAWAERSAGAATERAAPVAPVAPAAPAAPSVSSEPGELESDLDSLSAARRLRERFHGVLIGLATGDALAAATQYRKPGSFMPVGDLLGGGPFDLPRGGWSDETAMALCLAESLLECHGADARDQIERYRRWQQTGHLSATGECVGITASVAKALAAAAWRRMSVAGSHDPRRLDKELLCRVGPAVLYHFADPGRAIAQAAEVARTTCQAPAALDACRLFAAMLHAAVSGRPKAEVLEPTRALRATRGARRERPASAVGAGTTILDALETAAWGFASSSNFREGALAVVNLGGDSDVHAAAYGQLAGAYYGVSAIPAVWRNSLIRKEVIDQFADRLLTEALISLGSERAVP
jgi:ADP-ribosylglycohydrolase